jgi:hypothetical protein
MAAEKKAAARSTKRVPRVLWQNDDYRMVLTHESADGPSVIYEVADGVDSMGKQHWTAAPPEKHAPHMLTAIAVSFIEKPRRSVKRGTK